METQNIRQSIRSALDRIENVQYDNDYDRVAIVLSMAKDMISLVQTLCSVKKIRVWNTSDENTFDRFSAYLYKYLQDQAVYLEAISPEMLVDSNLLRNKLQDVLDRVAQVRQQKESILTEGEPLFAQMETLETRQQEVRKLLEEKKRLEIINDELSGIDVDQLRADVQKMEAAKLLLENEISPLEERIIALEAEIVVRRDVQQHIAETVNWLEKSKIAEVAQYVEKLTGWFDRLKSKHFDIQGKVDKLEADLQIEAEKLKTAANQFQENIRKSNMFSDKAYTCQEALKEHFRANQNIGESFANSLPGIQEQIEQLHLTLENNLSQSDQALELHQKKIEAANEKIKPLSL